ncbi:hypothetical protein DFS34DRAFT_651193 [Phlyctochytrium arcticum]|nr:hypothetical protein DFS34DRAFT_651193 [Phlyctochytrium arcticum]
MPPLRPNHYPIIVTALAAGLGLGALGTYIHLTKKQKEPIQISIPPVQNVPVAPEDVSHPALKFGHAGPISDFLPRQSYVASYNRQLKNPNWVAEHLTAASVAKSIPSGGGLPTPSPSPLPPPDTPDRSHSTFKEDVDIPRMFRARLGDYVKTGYDRGHLVPAADVGDSQSSLNETFLLTNISPQVGIGFNRHYWAYFEHFVRSLTAHFDDVYVVTGPLYIPKLNPDGRFYVTYEVIGDPPNTAVPTHFFKVVLGVKGTEYALQGFVLPNQSISHSVPLEEFAMPLDAIERSAGLVIYPNLNRLAYKPLCSVVTCSLVQQLWDVSGKKRRGSGVKALGPER